MMEWNEQQQRIRQAIPRNFTPTLRAHVESVSAHGSIAVNGIRGNIGSTGSSCGDDGVIGKWM